MLLKFPLFISDPNQQQYMYGKQIMRIFATFIPTSEKTSPKLTLENHANAVPFAIARILDEVKRKVGNFTIGTP